MKEKAQWLLIGWALVTLTLIAYFTGQIVAYQSNTPGDYLQFRQAAIPAINYATNGVDQIVKYLNGKK